MATEIAVLNIRVPDSVLPQLDQNVGYVILDLVGDDVARMVGDGWRPLSHQILPAPGEGLMVSLLCVRAERTELLLQV